MPTNTKVPNLIPPRTYTPSGGGGSVLPSADQFSLFDVALNGVGFMYSNTPENPLIRETAQHTKDRLDTAEVAGEQTLTGWWLKSQDSFHGGAGQLNLEPPFETQVSHVRYDLSKNIDPFTPGLVQRLPDTKVIGGGLTWTKVVGVAVSGADALAAIFSSGSLNLITNLDGSPSSVGFSGAGGVKDIVTDGTRIYAATNTQILSYDPTSTGTAGVVIATYPSSATTGPVLGWAKSRLLVGVNGAVYQVDVSQTGVTLGASQLLLQHPTPGWTWRCFSDSPTAVLAAGDANGFSEIDQFVLAEVGGAPQLQPGGAVVTLPVGERVLSLCNVMGSFQAVGTTKGVRIGQFDPYYGKLSIGPLTLTATDPVIPANAVLTRDRFVYAVGSAYDETGLIALDLSVQTDQSGRYAWAPHLIPPTANITNAATSGTVLPISGRIAFTVPANNGIMLEGTAPGSTREAWLRTSRIRYGTTEPKLFKLGSIRTDSLATSQVTITGITPTTTLPLGAAGFTTVLPPDDFKLPDGQSEWLQLQFAFAGSTSKFRGYATKALPGTRRQVRIKLVLAVDDSESTRSGQRIRDRLSARDRRDALESMAAAGDEVLLQEFTPRGVVSTVAVVESVSFVQVGRPTKTSDVGGDANVILRTVDL